MINGVYLSDAINTDDFRLGKINLIQSNCGSGKSYFAIKKLPLLASCRGKVVYLIDTIAMKEFLGLQEECKIYDPSDDEIIKGEIVNFSADDDKIIVMTYAKMGLILKKKPDLFDNVEIIICDEIHQIPKFIEWSKQKVKKLHPIASEEEIASILTYDCGAYLAAQYLENFAAGLSPDGRKVIKQKLIVGLSATPARAYAQFGQIIEDIKIKAQTRAYETLNTIYYTDLATVIREIGSNKKVLLYVPRITQMENGIKIARAMGVRAEGIWSVNNIEHKMSEEQIRIKDYLITNQQIPAEYDFLFINAAYETAINIYGNLDCVVLHTRDKDSQVQGRNRYRGDLDTQYVLADQDTIIEVKMPIEFLEVPLDKELKERICQYFKFTNKEGRIMGWTTCKKKLKEMGYEVKTIRPRVNGKQVSRDVISYGNEV